VGAINRRSWTWRPERTCEGMVGGLPTRRGLSSFGFPLYMCTRQVGRIKKGGVASASEGKGPALVPPGEEPGAEPAEAPPMAGQMIGRGPRVRVPREGAI